MVPFNTCMCISGLGRPAVLGDDDDDGGFGSAIQQNDLLTLEEFLNEANKDSKSGVGIVIPFTYNSSSEITMLETL